MQKILALTAICWFGGVVPTLAQNTWAGNTTEDMAEEQRACAGDAYRFCGGNSILIFEMENCLKPHLQQLTKACRLALSPTDFRKYHRVQPGLFDF